MINVSFPDGSKREYPDGSTPLSIAEAISKSLAKRSVIAKVDGQLFDMKRPLPGDVALELLDINAKESLDLIRHDASHVMAQAVQELFPGTQVTIGPTVEDGFYYDFA
ncbi:MAG TPA: TGS domain-containing protein, partial [Hyphomonadaceae bacterium]|nr:TGS domain-containing protein [Hyphomonadaceae bacterium]